MDSFLEEERQSIDEAEEYLMDRSALADRSARSAATAKGKGKKSNDNGGVGDGATV